MSGGGVTDRTGRVSQADLARRWGVSRQTVSRYVKQGMPVGSVEAAEDWRLRVKGKGPIMEARADASPPAEKGAPGDVGEEGVMGLVARCKAAEVRTWNILNEALERGAGATEKSSLLRNHKEAAANLMKVEQEAAAYRMQTRELVSMAEVQELIRKGLGPLRVFLNSLPAKAGPKANPGNPAQAADAIRELVEVELKATLERMK